MTIGTLIYILIFITSLLISVICLEYGTVAVLGVLVIVPLFMLIFLIVMRMRSMSSAKILWQKKIP